MGKFCDSGGLADAVDTHEHVYRRLLGGRGQPPAVALGEYIDQQALEAGLDFLDLVDSLLAAGGAEGLDKPGGRAHTQVCLDEQFFEFIEELVIHRTPAGEELVDFAEYTFEQAHIAAQAPPYTNRRSGELPPLPS